MCKQTWIHLFGNHNCEETHVLCDEWMNEIWMEQEIFYYQGADPSIIVRLHDQGASTI